MNKKLKYFAIIVTSIIILLFNNSVLAVGEMCIDVAKDGYSGVDSPTFNVSFEDLTGQITDANFLDIYDFLVNGVDINKIQNKQLNETYIEALEKLTDLMETYEAANVTQPGGIDVKANIEHRYGSMENAKNQITNILIDVEATEEQREDIEQSYNDVNEMANASESNNRTEITNSVANATQNNQQYHIYQNPEIVDDTESAAHSINDMIMDGDGFLSRANREDGAFSIEALKDFSNTYYNILLAIGIVASVIVGMILGIKLMLASPGEKAEVKQYIIPYIVGCVIVFGGFIIWKLAVTLLGNV